MRRLAARLRLPALLSLLALALWLAPRALERGDASARSTTAAASARIAPSPPSGPDLPAPSSPPPADTVFTVAEGPGVSNTYAVALDELYFPALPASRRLPGIAPQPGLAALLERAATLAAAGPEAAAPRLVLYPVGAPRNAVTRRIVNPRIEVALASADAPSPSVRPDLGIVGWDRPAYAPDHAIARIVGDAAQPLRAAAAAISLAGVRSARPLLARQHFPRFVPNDPLFKDQWHLRNTGQQGGKSGIDVRAVAAWDTTKGAGVVIGIVDNGVDLSHSDLAASLDNNLGYDWNDNDSDPSAEDHTIDYEGESYPAYDDHGTAVSGLAAARGNNGIGVAGVAPSATLAALRLIAAPTDDSEDAAAMNWRNDVIFVKNNSWGPSDSDSELFPAGPLWLSAVNDGVRNGRDGLGTLYFWAAGNGQHKGDQGTLDGYATARSVIAVAALKNTGAAASFSEGGPHLVVAAPGDASTGLVTTDRSGDYGYNSTEFGYAGEYRANIDYTRTFVGTSAASPVAAGVGALLLAARPDLGWRDVKEILLRSSTKLGSADWVSRPAGDAAHPIKHHPRLGGGLINAVSALSLAQKWTPLAEETFIAASPSAYDVTITDLRLAPKTITFVIPDDAPLLRVEHVVLSLNITHPRRGDLEITLTSPSGETASRFTQGGSLLVGADFFDYPFTSVRHWGETSSIPGDPTKKWTLTLRDSVTGPRDEWGNIASGVFHTGTLTLYGTPLISPAIVTDPADQTLATGSTLVLTAGFSGNNLDYEWRRNSQLIPGANTAELRLANFSAKLAGTYTCIAKNSLGSAEASASVSLDDSPRATHAIRVGATTSLDLGDYVEGDIVLWKSTTLPAGLKLDPVTGLVTGRPIKPGSYSIIVTATSRDGTVTKVPLSFAIAPLPAALVTTYVGLGGLDETANSARHGLLSLTLAANGGYTGTWTFNGRANSVKGLVDKLDDTAVELPVTVAPRKLANGTVIPGQTIRLRLPVDGSPARGRPAEFSSTTAPALPAPTVDDPIVLRRAAFSAAHPATLYAGRYTFVATDSSADLPVLGHAAGTLEVAANGKVKWLVHAPGLAKALTGSVTLADGGLLPLYIESGAPILEGWLGLGEAIEGNLIFSLSRTASVLGGRYARPAAGARLLGATEENPALFVTLESSQIASGTPTVLAEPSVTATAAQGIAVGKPNPPAFSATLVPASGLVTGRFTLSDPDPRNPAKIYPRVVSYTAVVLPAQQLILGTYLVPALPGGSSAPGAIEFAPAAAP